MRFFKRGRKEDCRTVFLPEFDIEEVSKFGMVVHRQDQSFDVYLPTRVHEGVQLSDFRNIFCSEAKPEPEFAHVTMNRLFLVDDYVPVENPDAKVSFSKFLLCWLFRVYVAVTRGNVRMCFW